MQYRILISTLVILSAFVTPWWIAVPLACLVSLVIYRYYELIVVGIIIDALYHPTPNFFSWPLSTTAICLCAFIASIYIKRMLFISKA